MRWQTRTRSERFVDERGDEDETAGTEARARADFFATARVRAAVFVRPNDGACLESSGGSADPGVVPGALERCEVHEALVTPLAARAVGHGVRR